MEKRGKGNLKIFIFALFVIEAFYLINRALNFIALPAFITNFDKQLTVVGAIFVLIAGFLVLLKKSKRKYREE